MLAESMTFSDIMHIFYLLTTRKKTQQGTLQIQKESKLNTGLLQRQAWKLRGRQKISKCKGSDLSFLMRKCQFCICNLLFLKKGTD